MSVGQLPRDFAKTNPTGTQAVGSHDKERKPERSASFKLAYEI